MQSLYILTEICAVCIYNDWFHIQTITYITKTNLRITCEIIIYVNWWGNKRCQRYWLYFESKYCGSHYRKWIWQFYNKTLSTLLQISKQSLWSFRQSHYREVLQWEIFMEQELRLGLDLGQLALLIKKRFNQIICNFLGWFFFEVFMRKIEILTKIKTLSCPH